MALLVSCVLTAMTMHSCGRSATSPASPVNVARNVTAGVCANRQAVTDAGSGDEAAPDVTLPPDVAARLHHADPSAAAIVAQAATCPTDTTTP
jgi:hypothetical protein